MRLRVNPAGVFLVILGVLFLAGGLLAAWLQARILTAWPQMPAESTGSSYNAYKTRGRVRYQVSYQLRFTVDGREYLVPSDPNLTFRNEAEARQLTHDYALGTQHAIRYSPANPYDVRENVSWTGPGLFGGIGLLLILVGSLLPKRAVTRREVTGRTSIKAAGAVLLTAGVPLLLIGVVTFLQCCRVLTRWTETNATVSRSELDAPIRHYVTHVRYRPIIEVQYMAHGRQYQSLAPMPETRSYARAQAAVAQFPLGAEVRVLFDPSHPEKVRVDAGWTWDFFLKPVLLGMLGLIFAPLGAVLLVQ